MLGFGKKKKREEPSIALPLWIWGRDYLNPAECHVRVISSRLAAGIAPGSRKCLAGKHDGNEDAMGLMALEGGHLLLLADSHFGALAAEQGLVKFLDAFQKTSGSMQERLFKTILLLDAMIRDEKAASEGVHPGCATTLIAAWFDEKRLVWSSLGDSFLWHIREGDAQLENERTSNFLGDHRPLMEPFVEALTRLNLLKPTVDVEDASLWWLISQLNRWVRGLDTDFASLQDLMASIKPYFGENVSLEELSKPWAPLHLAAKAVLPEWGWRRLKSGDRLLLATDGIEAPAKPISLEAILELACDSAQTPSETVDALLFACHGRKGGDDNLMCWVTDIS